MLTTYRITNGRTVIRLHRAWHPGRAVRNCRQRFNSNH